VSRHGIVDLSISVFTARNRDLAAEHGIHDDKLTSSPP